MKEIFILCNTPKCLEEISSGRFAYLQTKDIFTCNHAYTFIWTSGKHYNIIIDNEDIDFFVNDSYFMRESKYKRNTDKINFILSPFNEGKKDAFNGQYKGFEFSPVMCGGSSGLQAVLYCGRALDYDRIYFIGYLPIFEEFNSVGMPQDKKAEIDYFFSKYSDEALREGVYLFTKRK